MREPLSTWRACVCVSACVRVCARLRADSDLIDFLEFVVLFRAFFQFHFKFLFVIVSYDK